MGDYINDIKTIIFNFLENEYKSYLNENKILCIKENKLNEIIKDLYNNNTKNIKNIIRNTMKNKYKDNYKSASIEQIILDIFQDKDNNIQVIVNEINFILTLWKENIKDSIVTHIDAKTKLQEYSLKKFKKLPIYKLISNTGPRHKPIFKIGVKLPNSKYFIGIGSSKKDAEQNAAILCLDEKL